MTFEKPTRAVLISNPDVTWYFDKATKTAYQLPMEGAGWWSGFADSLFGKGTFEFFSVRHIGGADNPTEGEGPGVLLFTPTTADRFVASITITLSAEAPCVRRFMIATNRGELIRITLEAPVTNAGIGAKRFVFNPPKSARIITR
jgi:outer membrane lipoprotein-sorting protein